MQHAGEFSWDNVIVTGTFDGTTMTAVDVYGMFDPKAPQDPSETGDAEDAYKDLCSDPIQGTGPGDRSMEEVARALPGYQMDWPGGPNFNVAVTGDLVAARRALAPYVERVFCVATVPGPSRADGEPVAKAVSAIAGVEDSYYAANAQGAWITVVTLTDDQSVKAEVEKVVGASMWPRILFSSFFYPVKD
ncbi:hypothetical protein EAX62_06805 [Tessaracoccus antarcticus]|uniref:Uncharacterized protein n=1 Tax=Tessaracoccus antarcticus TaxID=2479848 RepID=A0A3M0GBA1_9ACTN|nr:hypothetical protein EAX62_06805 [Tessaracoccus antarcticus]